MDFIHTQGDTCTIQVHVSDITENWENKSAQTSSYQPLAPLRLPGVPVVRYTHLSMSVVCWGLLPVQYVHYISKDVPWGPHDKLPGASQLAVEEQRTSLFWDFVAFWAFIQSEGNRLCSKIYFLSQATISPCESRVSGLTCTWGLDADRATEGFVRQTNSQLSETKSAVQWHINSKAPWGATEVQTD